MRQIPLALGTMLEIFTCPPRCADGLKKHFTDAVVREGGIADHPRFRGQHDQAPAFQRLAARKKRHLVVVDNKIGANLFCDHLRFFERRTGIDRVVNRHVHALIDERKSALLGELPAHFRRFRGS